MTDIDEGWVVNFVPDNPQCQHSYPSDWIFGGATGEDPRTDPRWMPATYLFIDRTLQGRHITSEPRCDHEAAGPYRLRLNKRLPKSWEIAFVTAQADKGKPRPIFVSDASAVVSLG